MDDVIQFMLGYLGLFLAVFAWVMCPGSKDRRAKICHEFKGAKQCFRPKVIRPQFHLYRLLRGLTVLFINVLLVKALWQGKLSGDSFLILMAFEAVLIVALYELMRLRYRQDLVQCRAMHRTCPTALRAPEPERFLLVGVAYEMHDPESDR